MDLEMCRDFKELARLTDMLNTERDKSKRRAIWRQISREFVKPEVHMNCGIRGLRNKRSGLLLACAVQVFNAA